MKSKLEPEFITEEGIGYDHIFGASFVELSTGQTAYFAGHENLLRVEITAVNNLMSDHGAPRIEKGGIVRIWSNDYQIYSYRFTEVLQAVVKLVQVLDRIENFPMPLRGREDIQKLIRRKVYWREFPAIISDFEESSGRVRLTADNVDGRFVVAPWEKDEDPKHFSMVKVDLLSPEIHWFRDEEE